MSSGKNATTRALKGKNGSVAASTPRAISTRVGPSGASLIIKRPFASGRLIQGDVARFEGIRSAAKRVKTCSSILVTINACSSIRITTSIRNTGGSKAASRLRALRWRIRIAATYRAKKEIL